MPLIVDWPNKFITVQKSELTLIDGTRYKITVDYWWQLLREMNASQEGMPFDTMYQSIAPTTSTPRIVELINGYTASFEDGLYSVELVNGNTNWREIEVKNQVSVGTNNTTGFIDPVFLESSLFLEGVIVDVINGVAGTGKTGDGGIIGTRKTPSNNMVDAHEIALFRGTPKFVIVSSMSIADVDLSDGHTIIGDTPFTMVTLDPSANLSGLRVRNLTVQGEMDGVNTLEDCFILDVTNISGVVHQCAFGGNTHISGDINIFDGYSRVEGGGYPTFQVFGHALVARNFRGSFGVLNAESGHLSSIGIQGGRLIAESSCTGGEIHMRGEPFDVRDESGVPGLLIDETMSKPVLDLHEAHYNKRIWDKNNDTVTVYDTDGITPLHVFDTNSDLSQMVPQ